MATTLLLWGDHDEVSPLPVGERLATLLPNAALRVVPGGTHGFAREHPDRVAALIAAHLVAAGEPPARPRHRAQG